MHEAEYMNPATDGTPERPLVTFALFAYNQEKYIREAVEGAFSQTYEPLEIILSDDCSTDRTFEIMQEMATTYTGPHRITVRRNPANYGTPLHVACCFRISTGNLFIVAAGDDISVPGRTTALVEAWTAQGCPVGVVHSGRETFVDARPTETRIHAANAEGEGSNVLACFAEGHWLPAAAPTCAYSREIFDRFPPLRGGGFIEDAPLMLRGALIGTYVRCDHVLVRQRLNSASVGSGYRLADPARWNRFLQSKQLAFGTMQADLRCAAAEHRSRIVLHAVERKILRVIRSASALHLPESQPIGLLETLRFTALGLISPAISERLVGRVGFILSFMGQSALRATLTRFIPGRSAQRS